MRDVGSSLIETLESYLPREQSKLNIIGCKVLDIFYDEFVKFVPAYILKREEEKRESQQPQPLDNSPSQLHKDSNNPLTMLKQKRTARKSIPKAVTVPNKKLPSRAPH